MKIAVLIKQTPDTAELPKVSAEDVQAGAVKVTMVINPWDEFAAEEAIQLGDRYNADAVAISMGAPEATDALKHALAMGIAEAKLIDNRGVKGDMWTTAGLLAAAIKAEGADLVLAGKQSVDENSSAVFVGVAQKLGWPLLSSVTKVTEIAGGKITVERMVDGSQETVSAPLPVVVSVGKEINEPRYPSFMGIRKASRAQIPAVKAADLAGDDLTARTQWNNIRKPEERKTDVVIFDGATTQEKVKKLADALVAAKVL